MRIGESHWPAEFLKRVGSVGLCKECGKAIHLMHHYLGGWTHFTPTDHKAVLNPGVSDH